MTDTMILRAERMVRHSRRFWMRLCAFCERPVGLATAPASGPACDHRDELLRQARARVRTLGRPHVAPCAPPAPRRSRAGRASLRSRG